MTQIAGYKLQAMVQSSGSNLNICIRKDCPGFFKVGTDSPEYFGSSNIIGEDGDSGKYALLYTGATFP